MTELAQALSCGAALQTAAQRARRPALFALLFLLVAIPSLWMVPFNNSSEAREGQIIATMIRSGEYILPLRNGLIPSKPPLYHWSGLLPAWLLHGVTPFTARIPAAFFGAITVFFAALLAAGWARRMPGGSPDRAAASTAVILTLSYGFTSMALQARVDIALACFCMIAVYFGLRNAGDGAASSGRAARLVPPRDLNLFFAACGFAVLAKGPLGAALPGVMVFAALACEFGLRRTCAFWLRPCAGWIVFLAVACPWYLLAYLRGSDAFLEKQLITENVSRVLGQEAARGGPFFYLPCFFKNAFPWSLLLLAGLIDAVRTRIVQTKESAGLGSFGRRAALAAFAAGLVLFSLSAGRRASYLLPLYPAVSIWLALYAEARGWRFAPGRLQRILVQVLATLSAGFAVLGLVVFVLPDFDRPITALAISILRGIAPGILLYAAAAGAAAAIAWRRPSHLLPLYAAALLLFVSMQQTGFAVKDGLEQYDDFSRRIAAIVPRDANLVVTKERTEEYFDPIFFYLDREIALAAPGDKVACPAYLLCLLPTCDRVPRAEDEQWEELARLNSFRHIARQQHDEELILSRCTLSTP